MLKEPIEKESIFNVNPSKPSESNYIITDLYTSFEQISVPDKQARGTILTRSHMLNPSLWGALMVLGLLTSFIGFTVDYLSQKLLQTRLYISSSDNSLWNVTIWLVYSLFFAVIATSTGKFMSSDAEGSGIPEVKSILSGIHINKYLSISTLSAKIVGLISASAAGLSIGKEGPFVHISAILANKMTKINYMRGLQNNLTIRQQILGASVAAGVAAAFGAPIGGVLFSIEVTTTYYVVNNLWKGMFCAIWCTIGFTLFHSSEITDLIHLTKFEPIEFGPEILFFGLLGALSGLLGVGFVYTASKLIYLRVHMAYPSLHTRFRYTVLVTLICAIINYSAPFLQLSDKSIINQMFRAEPLSNYEQLYWNNPSTAFNLALYVIIKLGLTALSISCQIPSGFVAPVFTGGAAFGRLFGYFVDMVLGTEHKGVYAVVGAASLVSSVTHTLSIAIIVFELTGQMNYILPMIIGVLISYSISASISMSMYNVILKIKGLPYLPSIKSSSLYSRNVQDLTSSQVSLTLAPTVRKIIRVVNQAKNFTRVPLIDRENYLIGEIAIQKLKTVIVDYYSSNTSRLSMDDKQFLNKYLSLILAPGSEHLEHWAESEETVEVHKFLEAVIDIDTEIIDFAPLSVPENLSLVKVQFMFIMMGLVQVSVVSKGKFLGTISRDSFTRV